VATINCAIKTYFKDSSFNEEREINGTRRRTITKSLKREDERVEALTLSAVSEVEEASVAAAGRRLR